MPQAKRRLLSLFGLLLVLSMVLSACVPVAQAPAGEQAAAPAGEKVKLTFWHHTYTVATDWMRGKIAEYQEMNPNVEIELVEYPHGDYEVKLLAAISAGDPPDIINLLDYLFPKYACQRAPGRGRPGCFRCGRSAGRHRCF